MAHRKDRRGPARHRRGHLDLTEAALVALAVLVTVVVLIAYYASR